jgi:hypothetical protein
MHLKQCQYRNIQSSTFVLEQLFLNDFILLHICVSHPSFQQFDTLGKYF